MIIYKVTIIIIAAEEMNRVVSYLSISWAKSCLSSRQMLFHYNNKKWCPYPKF